MKKILSAVLVLLFAALSAQAFSWHWTKRISGRIEYFGNAPFEYAGFVTDDNKEYFLEVEKKSKFTVKDIEALYGHKIQLKGYEEKNNGDPVHNLKDGKFVVKSFKAMTIDEGNK